MIPGPGQRLSHYRLEEKIGEGGMGQVYRAWDLRLERRVAIKLIADSSLADPAARKRLLREARAASALNHPNICVVHEVEDTGALAFIVMEHVEGKALRSLVPPEGLPPETVLRYAIQIAGALAHAHSRGVVHRDLKCANVVVTPEGRAKVLDFGLAVRLGQATSGEELTRSLLPGGDPGGIQGTLAYLPPEVLRGAPADTRGDLWSLGAMVFEMTSGHPPFRGKTAFELSSDILNGSPAPLPPGIPASLRSLILRCLEKDPDRRFQSAGEVRAALEAIRPAPARAGSAGTRVAKAPRSAVRKRRPRSASPVRALAVLPLENLSGDPSQEYFADGMTEALIASLAKIGKLRVISRTSIMLYKGVRRPLPEIARELKVDAVVEGSVLREGDRVRITAQLIRAAADEHLWAETYDRDLRDVLTLQSEVARAIAHEVRAKVTPREAAGLTRAKAVNPAAFEAYLRGRYAWNRRTAEGMAEGIGHFQKAFETDPSYAAAFAGLADCYNVLGFWGALSPRDSFLRAKAAAQRALDLEADLSEAHCSLAYTLHHYEWDWSKAEEAYLQSLRLNPAYPTGHHWYALLQASLGRFPEAVKEMEKAEELDPLSQIILLALGFVFYLAGDLERAAAQLRRTAEVHASFWAGWAWLALVHSRQGRHEEAVGEGVRAAELCGDLPVMDAILAHIRARAGRREEALETMERLAEKAKEKYVMPYAVALIHAGLGDGEAALDWLERAAEERGNLLAYLAVDPAFEPFRSHARFKDLLRRIGLPA